MKLVDLIILLIIILIFGLMYSTVFNIYEGFEDNNIEIVVARYNEDLEWLKEEPFNKLPIVIYNKGINDTFYKPPSLKRIVNLPNVGVCDHTYLYHIIENYDNLANVTIFLPGSCSDNHKKTRSINVVNKTIEKNNTVIYASYDEDANKNLHDFTLDEWTPTNNKNKEIIKDTNLRKCEIRPYGKWFKEVFKDITLNYVTYLGIFSASRDHIHNRSKESYEKLIEFINKSKNEECAHYIERSYVAIFHPLPADCLYR